MQAHHEAAWRPQRGDLRPVITILLLPFLLAAPQLLGWLHADPLIYTAQVSLGQAEGVLRGVPYIDPNNGFGTQALGHLAAKMWLEGQVPWWNYFSGVGMPLAAEYQPAAFFPLTFLMLFSLGPALQQAALQAITGLATYGLLSHLRFARAAATIGALLYAFNGTLAWHAHAPATALPFLPLMLWGVERAFAFAQQGEPGGWRLVALAMVAGLICGFPEVSYVSGLLALAWAIVRGFQLPKERRAGYAGRIALGGFVGIAISAPQVYAFFQFLPHAYVGDHTNFAEAALHKAAMLPSFLAPYAYGPIFIYAWGKPLFVHVWGGIGGFVTAAALVTAVYGFWVRRDAIAWMLAVAFFMCVCGTFDIEPVDTLVDWIPGTKFVAFGRYAPPLWEFAVIFLAARGIDAMLANPPQRPAPSVAATVAALLALLAIGIGLAILWPQFTDRGMRNSAIASAAWAAATLAATVALVWRGNSRASTILGVVLVFEAMFMTFIPTLSNPRAGRPDAAAIDFLRGNLGSSRFYTLGPIQANYGAYFEIASINHNYLPVASRWIDFVHANLDAQADPVVFNGDYARPPGAPTQLDEFRRNFDRYRWVGVKYLVARPGDPGPGSIPALRKVYSDAAMAIYELPDPSPYFESTACRVSGPDREHAVADCEKPGRLVRRELFFPGWRASVNGIDAPIAVHGDLFQEIALPAGRSEVRFSYAPPHIGWAWLASAAGLLVLGAGLVRRARRSAASGRSAS